MIDYLDWQRDYRDPAVASVYDELSLWSSRFGALLLENVPLAHGMRVLDLGCGTGFPLYELAHVLGRSSRLWGADLWREAVARARSKQDVYALPNVAVAVADGARLRSRRGASTSSSRTWASTTSTTPRPSSTSALASTKEAA